MRHLRSLFDLSGGEVHEILALAADLKRKFQKGERPALLPGRVLAMVFEKPSLRTRNSFEAAMLQLGGGAIFITSKEAGLNGRRASRKSNRGRSAAPRFIGRPIRRRSVRRWSVPCPIAGPPSTGV